MQKRKFPIINIVILAAVVFVLITVNRNKAVPDERTCSYIIEGEVVQLIGGSSDVEISEGAASRQLTDFIISKGGSDLNGDSRSDSVVFLRQSSGGSGTFYYVAAALGTGKGYRGTNAVFIGDRIEPLDISFDGEAVIVTFLGRGDGEPYSAKPTVEKELRLRIEDGLLAEE